MAVRLSCLFRRELAHLAFTSLELVTIPFFKQQGRRTYVHPPSPSWRTRSLYLGPSSILISLYDSQRWRYSNPPPHSNSWQRSISNTCSPDQYRDGRSSSKNSVFCLEGAWFEFRSEHKPFWLTFRDSSQSLQVDVRKAQLLSHVRIFE
jgi:hypothetical protein